MENVDTEYFSPPFIDAETNDGKTTYLANKISDLAFRKSWLKSLGCSKKIVLMKINSDSMAPTINDGDIVLVDMSIKSFYPGIYIIQIHDILDARILEPRVENMVYVTKRTSQHQ